MNRPEYNQLQDLCDKLSEPVNISGLQGFISGVLSVNSRTTLSSCLRQYGDGELAGYSLANNPLLGSEFEQLYNLVHYELNETEFDYQLYLPDEEETLGHRLRALASWCDDFLLAFGLTYDDQSSEDYIHAVHKILANFAEFSKVDWREIKDDEESELDYQQLTEFIRMGVIHIHSDFHTPTKIRANH